MTTETLIGFAESALDLSEENWSDIERYNATLARLMRRRKSSIEVAGPFIESKTAWKCATLQQAFLYRTVALAKGCADEWNAGNFVCSILAARALLETVAICCDVTEQIEKHVETRDVIAIHNLANQQLFATRDATILSSGAGFEAKNAMTYVQHLKNKLPDIFDHYLFLCEWCHPNSNGHFLTFGDLDVKTGTVHFAEKSDHIFRIQGHVITTFMLIGFVEQDMETFDKLVPKVALLEAGLGPWMS